MLIDELIPNTNIENHDTEFKGILDQGRDKQGKSKEIGWLKTLAAFANGKGGTLFVGVDNRTHNLLALSHTEADKTVLLVQHQIKERIDPNLNYSIEAIAVPQTKPLRYVLAIRVSPSRILPVTLHEQGLLGIYVRNFGETVLASAEQIRDLILLSDSQPYDSIPTDTKYARENFQKLFATGRHQGVAITEKALIAKGFMTSDLRLTKGALLFSDNCSDGLRTKVVATLWPGTNKGSSVVLSSAEHSGNLLDTIEFALAFVQSRSVNGFRKTNRGREPVFSYPERSVLEGIVNAVGHRNYFIQGSQIEVNLFSDRLEISSPGSLLGVQSLRRETNIAAIVPRRRNEVICSILELCRLMEKKGSGFDKIEEDYRPYGENYRPYINADSSSFTLALPNLTNSAGVAPEGAIPSAVAADVILTGKYDQKILSFCFGQSRDAKAVAEHLGLRYSSYLRNGILQKLVEAGLLRKTEERGSAKYLTNSARVRMAGY